MLDLSWIFTSADSALMAILSALGIYLSLVLFTRLAGLRSFSKMSSFDFAVTVAFGSLLASTVLTQDPPLVRAIVALATLYLIQYGASILRLRFEGIKQLIDNDPILLMSGPEFLNDNMKKGRVTRADVYSKLREANVSRMDQIKAVVLETTGDISVLHGDPNAPLDTDLLRGVRGSERLG